MHTCSFFNFAWEVDHLVVQIDLFLDPHVSPKKNIKLLHYLRPALTEFNGYLPRKAQRLLSLESTGMYTRVINADGKVTVTGGKRLKESGAYTKSFGKKVANLFKKKTCHLTLFRQFVSFKCPDLSDDETGFVYL